MTTELREFIVTERRTGFVDDDMPVHRHTQIYTKDGELVAELCGYKDCETMEPPEWDIV
jgi:hypothetical protein